MAKKKEIVEKMIEENEQKEKREEKKNEENGKRRKEKLKQMTDRKLTDKKLLAEKIGGNFLEHTIKEHHKNIEESFEHTIPNHIIDNISNSSVNIPLENHNISFPYKQVNLEGNEMNKNETREENHIPEKNLNFEASVENIQPAIGNIEPKKPKKPRRSPQKTPNTPLQVERIYPRPSYPQEQFQRPPQYLYQNRVTRNTLYNEMYTRGQMNQNMMVNHANQNQINQNMNHPIAHYENMPRNHPNNNLIYPDSYSNQKVQQGMHHLNIQPPKHSNQQQGMHPIQQHGIYPNPQQQNIQNPNVKQNQIYLNPQQPNVQNLNIQQNVQQNQIYSNPQQTIQLNIQQNHPARRNSFSQSVDESTSRKHKEKKSSPRSEEPVKSTPKKSTPKRKNSLIIQNLTPKICSPKKKDLPKLTKQIKETRLQRVTRELEILKNEMFTALETPMKYRYLVEFEKSNIENRVDSQTIPFNPKKRVRHHLIQHSLLTPELLSLADRYHKEIENLPLQYVLRGTDKFVPINDWQTANIENEHAKILKTIARMRKKKVFERILQHVQEKEIDLNNGNIDVLGSKTAEDAQNEMILSDRPHLDILNNLKIKSEKSVNKFKLMAKKIAEEAQLFVEKNTLNFDEIHIFRFPYRVLHHKQDTNIPSPESEPLSDVHFSILSLMSSKRSKTTFKTPQLKKKGTCHGSHTLAVSKIPNELGILKRPSEIIKFKIMRGNQQQYR